MASYLTFSYSDNLPKSIKKNLPQALTVSGENDPELLLIIRILSGNLELTHNYSNKSVKHRKNYFYSDLTSFQNWKIDFPKLFSEETNSDDLAEFIFNTKFTNRSFYKIILAEISHFILHERKSAHTSAFIFIYRILEKISYAFPMIYASKSSDFLKSFNELKELMTGSDEKKELGFFKKFVETIHQGDPIADTSIDISIEAENSNVQKQMFKAMKDVTNVSAIHEDTTEHGLLCIKYCEMGSFIINIRNRFFHNLNGGSKNIESNRIVDSDEFFRFINPMAMHWLSMILFKVTHYSLSNFQNHRRNSRA